MADNATTRCIVTGDEKEISRFSELMITPYKDNETGKEGLWFDFNKIIPMPEIIKTAEESHQAETGAALILLKADRSAPYAVGSLYRDDVEKIRTELKMENNPINEVADVYLKKYPEYETKGMQRLKAVVETGYSGWWAWSISKWGTKWNSYEFEILSESPLEFWFRTAWYFPVPVFEALAKEFPLIQFQCFCYAEGGYAGIGCFNPTPENKSYAKCEQTKEIYKLVFDEDEPEYEDE